MLLNKSRYFTKQRWFNSFLPTIRIQGFNDSFRGFTFFVEKKIDNEIKNVFIYDAGNTLKNLKLIDLMLVLQQLLPKKVW